MFKLLDIPFTDAEWEWIKSMAAKVNSGPRFIVRIAVNNWIRMSLLGMETFVEAEPPGKAAEDWWKKKQHEEKKKRTPGGTPSGGYPDRRHG